VRLDIGMLRAEYLFCPVAGEILNYIGIFTTPVVASPRVTFSILIGEGGTGRLKHRL